MDDFHLQSQTNDSPSPNYSANSTISLVSNTQPKELICYLTEDFLKKTSKTDQEGLRKIQSLSITQKSHKIKYIENLDILANLVQLDLSSNVISKIDGLQKLNHLTTLNLSENKITKVENIFHLKKLLFLNLSGNQISQLPFSKIWGILQRLKELKLSNNQINTLQNIEYLQSLKSLTNLSLSGNPISNLPHYRQFVVFHLRTLDVLDSFSVSIEERKDAIDRLSKPELETIQKLYEESENIRKLQETRLLEFQKELIGSKKSIELLQQEKKKYQENQIKIQTELEAKNQLLVRKNTELSKMTEDFYSLKQELEISNIETGGYLPISSKNQFSIPSNLIQELSSIRIEKETIFQKYQEINSQFLSSSTQTFFLQEIFEQEKDYSKFQSEFIQQLNSSIPLKYQLEYKKLILAERLRQIDRIKEFLSNLENLIEKIKQTLPFLPNEETEIIEKSLQEQISVQLSFSDLLDECFSISKQLESYLAQKVAFVEENHLNIDFNEEQLENLKKIEKLNHQKLNNINQIYFGYLEKFKKFEQTSQEKLSWIEKLKNLQENEEKIQTEIQQNQQIVHNNNNFELILKKKQEGINQILELKQILEKQNKKLQTDLEFERKLNQEKISENKQILNKHQLLAQFLLIKNPQEISQIPSFIDFLYEKFSFQNKIIEEKNLKLEEANKNFDQFENEMNQLQLKISELENNKIQLKEENNKKEKQVQNEENNIEIEENIIENEKKINLQDLLFEQNNQEKIEKENQSLRNLLIETQNSYTLLLNEKKNFTFQQLSKEKKEEIKKLEEILQQKENYFTIFSKQKEIELEENQKKEEEIQQKLKEQLEILETEREELISELKEKQTQLQNFEELETDLIERKSKILSEINLLKEEFKWLWQEQHKFIESFQSYKQKALNENPILSIVEKVLETEKTLFYLKELIQKEKSTLHSFLNEQEQKFQYLNSQQQEFFQNENIENNSSHLKKESKHSYSIQKETVNSSIENLRNYHHMISQLQDQIQVMKNDSESEDKKQEEEEETKNSHQQSKNSLEIEEQSSWANLKTQLQQLQQQYPNSTNFVITTTDEIEKIRNEQKHLGEIYQRNFLEQEQKWKKTVVELWDQIEELKRIEKENFFEKSNFQQLYKELELSKQEKQFLKQKLKEKSLQTKKILQHFINSQKVQPNGANPLLFLNETERELSELQQSVHKQEKSLQKAHLGIENLQEKLNKPNPQSYSNNYENFYYLPPVPQELLLQKVQVEKELSHYKKVVENLSRQIRLRDQKLEKLEENSPELEVWQSEESKDDLTRKK